MNSNDTSAVPNAITMYQTAHDRRDVVTALAQFTVDAIIVDDGRTYEGAGGVETFLQKSGSEYSYTRTLISASNLKLTRYASDYVSTDPDSI